MGQSCDVLVIGGGILGLATAYRLSLDQPDLKLVLLEKEPQLARHQTGHNSGVIHSGLYYKPDSLKAKFCFSGRRELIQFAQEQGIRHEICGKIVVATEPEELERLQGLEERGKQNGLAGVKLIDPKEIKELEPYCAGIQALHVPEAGIIDYPGLAERLAQLILQNPNAKIIKGVEVHHFEKSGAQWLVKTSQHQYQTSLLIQCAGLHSDRWLRGEWAKRIRIIPFRGDYYELIPEAKKKLKNLIYPVPDPRFPFLGVHLTRMVGGSVECGPNAVFSFAREGYGKFDFDLGYSLSTFGFPGLWALFARHWQYGLGEYHRALSKQTFLKSLQRLVPSLRLSDLRPGRSGLRAQAVDDHGNLLDDFAIIEEEGLVQVVNAPSPAATSSLALGSEIAQRGLKHL
ncbi:MAG: hypothetical protein A2527_12885 [Candidatus Lambdaproteobacteria bacterium RIFOXYD2_FULL_50_16]|uniref:FAD dependent oxidoreductase domain-containing protein n=1 Tax=Candidatus Lambdaproteobacteria bacterium RIFOXYD2_FULL_50_16 TaxID=1817772 RepID=A0A1F6G9Q6_9PROT|nr:MAG: hypothetical protein A2527_12885 [Candidatus Lambdaproteobacteria bacterium RIFOXYD2_FULL_50_16]